MHAILDGLDARRVARTAGRLVQVDAARAVGPEIGRQNAPARFVARLEDCRA
jgi:hypothetical protein